MKIMIEVFHKQSTIVFFTESSSYYFNTDGDDVANLVCNEGVWGYILL